MPTPWVKIDHCGLCRLVDDEARKKLAPEVNSLDYAQDEDGVRKLVEVLYAAVIAKGVNYALEPIRSTSKVQEIRVAEEILKKGEGTCLDLSLLFCGLCIGCELMPILVVLDGHALVVVPLNHRLRDWRNRRNRPESNLFDNVVIYEDKGEKLRELINSGAYMAVECTGFARGASLASMGDKPECLYRGQGGTMTFDDAVKAGAQQFDPAFGRPFKFALDIATWQSHHPSEAIEDEESAGASHAGGHAPQAEQFSDPLPYLLDRSEQEDALRGALHQHRALNKLDRPLVCIVHGSEAEYHPAFLDRLEQVSLPGILKLWYPEEAAQIPVARPEGLKLFLAKLTEKNYREVIWAALAKSLVGDKFASPEVVVNRISCEKLAVMLNLQLFSEDLEGGALRGLDLFLDFWNCWEKLSEKLLLLVCLSLRYRDKYESKRKFRILWKTTGLNEEIRRYVTEVDFSKYQNLDGVCLPELEAIEQEDVEEFLKRAPAKRAYKVGADFVVKMYGETQGKRIPMLTLLDAFKRPEVTR